MMLAHHHEIGGGANSSRRSRNHNVVVIRGEICLLITSLRRTTRWNTHQQESKSDIILRKLQALKESLDSGSRSTSLKIYADAKYFLVPFLDVIRSEEISGPVTALALSSIEKFIAYGIISETNGVGGAVEAITDAVIHAHFVSTDSASDEIVLMKILNVLHRLFISPLGPLLSNENVCELMQACFRMCFIERANELLRKSAEMALTEMVRILFSRLHTFPTVESMKKFKTFARSSPQPTPIVFEDPSPSVPETRDSIVEPDAQMEDLQIPGSEFLEDALRDVEETDVGSKVDKSTSQSQALESGPVGQDLKSPPEIHVEGATPETGSVSFKAAGEFKNSSGVRFTTALETEPEEERTKSVTPSHNISRDKITVPYGIPCVRELFRFLITLINPHEKSNSDVMIHLGLKLLLVAVEVGVEGIGKYTPLMYQVKNELSKNLIGLLGYSTPGSVGSASNSSVLLTVLRILFILFDNLRASLKYQLEVFMTRVGELINESGPSAGGNPSGSAAQTQGRWNYEQREMTLDFLVQLWKLPCFVAEMYLNYDCDLFCSNLFEDTTKLLSKNAFPMQTGINSIHLLCLDGLASILDGIEGHCTSRISTNTKGAQTQNSSSGGSDESNSSVFYHDEHSDVSPRDVVIDPHGHGEGDVGLDGIVTPVKDFSVLPAPRRGSLEDPPLPTHEQLMAIRHKKKIFHTGSEHFNNSASKGIEFLQNHGILGTPLDPVEVAQFLRDNPLLEKRAIGDYISNRKNAQILHAFVYSFEFASLRIDEALRIFLETFRLPGEAGPIASILEEFAAHWSVTNGNPFANVDAAYILAYQVIMLNVDQHNSNVKKQGNCMTLAGLKANLKGCNGNQDFDPEMLSDIYNAIKSEEIVMPAEQTGLLKENYLWKVLLKRESAPCAKFQSPTSDVGIFDHDLFSLSWGPIVAALSFIYDKTSDSAVITKTLTGFRKCATIAAHYGMCDVFDNLVISLCKFTTLISVSPDLGSSLKAQSSCRQVFQLVHRHGDILREGWKNFVDCLASLFKQQLLPKILTESEDFTDPSGRVSIIRRSQISVPIQEAGLFSSIYSYIALSADSPGSKSSLVEEEENRKKIQVLIIECRPELLLSESKFLQLESLMELIKSLIYASPVPETKEKRKDYDEDQTVFALEVLLKISIQNRDRALAYWDMVREHLFALIFGAAKCDMPYILERATVGLLRVALRLMRKEDLCPIILQSLRVLLFLRPGSVMNLSSQLSFGLHEVLKTTAANIHTTDEWSIIFTLLEYFGAGKVPPVLHSAIQSGTHVPGTWSPVRSSSPYSHQVSRDSGREGFLSLQHQHSISQDPLPLSTNQTLSYSSGSDRGYTSDSELELRSGNESGKLGNVSPAQSWILLSQDDQQLGSQVRSSHHSPSHRMANALQQPGGTVQPQQIERQLFYPDPKSLVKSTESLSFLVRDAAHITPDNFTLCVGAIRSFVEASTLKAKSVQAHQSNAGGHSKKKRNKRGGEHHLPKSKSFSAAPTSAAYDADESDSDDQIAASQHVCIQLLDLLHTLHTRATQIFQWWQKEMSSSGLTEQASIWSLGWKPLLQAIVVLCSDARRPVRTTALTYLQRALLVHDLQQLSPLEWESCFNEVLFPLMARLLEPICPTDSIGMEETRMRAATLLCKVFLQHLNPLLQLEEFPTLWLNILEFLNKYMNHSDRSELLIEAIPESLKNLLLVMETAGIFHTPEGYTRLWAVTWEKIDSFLPSLRADLIRSVPPVETPQAQASENVDGIPQPTTELSSSVTEPNQQTSELSTPPQSENINITKFQSSSAPSKFSLINPSPPSEFVPVVFSTSPPDSDDLEEPVIITNQDYVQPTLNDNSSSIQQPDTDPVSSSSGTNALLSSAIADAIGTIKDGEEETLELEKSPPPKDNQKTPSSPKSGGDDKVEYTSILFGDDDDDVESSSNQQDAFPFSKPHL